MIPHAVTISGKRRVLSYGGASPIVDADGVCHFSTAQHCSQTIPAAVIETSHPTGMPGRLEQVGGEWVLTYRTGDPITAGKCRSQIHLPPLPQGDYLHAMSFRVGSDAHPWERRAPGVSPVLIWQLKSPAPGQPVLSVNLDTDPFNPARLALIVSYKPHSGWPSPERAATVFGLDPAAVHSVELGGRFAPDESGFVRVTVNGEPVATIRGRTMSDDLPHQVGAGCYLYTHADPANAPTRVTRWQRLVVY